jgi:hypothetical protein
MNINYRFDLHIVYEYLLLLLVGYQLFLQLILRNNLHLIMIFY